MTLLDLLAEPLSASKRAQSKGEGMELTSAEEIP